MKKLMFILREPFTFDLKRNDKINYCQSISKTTTFIKMLKQETEIINRIKNHAIMQANKQP
jgi:intein-encoded DNA endonuclease-like protein